MAKTKIEWTDTVWNPTTGCTKISPGCNNCYAERMALRLHAMGNKKYINGFNLSMHNDLVYKPLEWKSPKIIFVNSMSDLFHEDVSDNFIFRIFETMSEAYWHKFQILTKRSNRLIDLDNKISWPKNAWIGVSVENDSYLYRIKELQKIKTRNKFISFEPLLGKIKDIDLNFIEWVIVGGESGPQSRKIEEEWVLHIRDECLKNETPFFFKQWGGVNKRKTGRKLEGRYWNEVPLGLFQHV